MLSFDEQQIYFDRQRRWERGVNEIQLAQAKRLAVEEVKYSAYVRKQILKMEQKEFEKGIYEEVLVGANGEIQLVTRNAAINPKAREVTNMANPKLTIFVRGENADEEIFCLNCEVGGEERRIFLRPEKMATGGYLLRKFSSRGIYFKLSTARAKDVAIQLICKLLEGETKKVVLPEKCGWYKTSEGTFRFVEEGELTWKKAEKLSK